MSKAKAAPVTSRGQKSSQERQSARMELHGRAFTVLVTAQHCAFSMCWWEYCLSMWANDSRVSLFVLVALGSLFAHDSLYMQAVLYNTNFNHPSDMMQILF